MTPATLATLIALLEPTRGLPGEHQAVARAAVDACVDEGAWAGETCLYALLALAREESSLRAAPGRRWGAGPWQLQPGRSFRWRGVKVTVPKSSELEHPEIAATWALRVLETKYLWCAGKPHRWRCTFRIWNSTARAPAFARRVERWVKAMRQ
jgi:hypothetical protein